MVFEFPMTKRSLYIAAYDIADPSRLRRMHLVVKGFATGGQKSVFECFLSASEKRQLQSQACNLMDETEDRFALLRIEERTRPLLYGIAVEAKDPEFYYVG